MLFQLAGRGRRILHHQVLKIWRIFAASVCYDNSVESVEIDSNNLTLPSRFVHNSHQIRFNSHFSITPLLYEGPTINHGRSFSYA